MTTTRRWAALLAGTLALAACDRDAPEPEPAASETDAEPREAVSIIRPDVEVEREDAPPLAALDTRIGFADGGSELDMGAEAELETVLQSPQIKAGGAIVLRGHSDSDGTDAANMRASVSRAEAVRDWLVEKGVAEDRIAVIGFGEQNPVEPNALPNGEPNEQGRALNRRVDLRIEVPEGTPEARPADDPPTLVGELNKGDD